MATANIISMAAQPAQASYLCFEVSGVLDTCRVQLGDTVKDIPFFKLAERVKTAGTVAGDPSRLACDGSGIMQEVDHLYLATLRNEDRKAALNSAVNTRQNLYFSKHANAASVISTIKGYFSKTSPASNANLLESLSNVANQQASALQEAYTEDDRTGVVRSTSSSLESRTSSSGSSNRAGKFYQQSVGRRLPKGTMVPQKLPLPWEGTMQGNQLLWPSGYQSIRFKSDGITPDTAITVGVNYEESSNAGHASGYQSSVHVDYEYRTPYLEAQARNLRAQISLREQKFELFMLGQNIPHLEQIFKNELDSVDNDVHQLQIALLKSILVSPVPGIVTGIYKSPGEAVAAGEPVLRVENNAEVHLVAHVVFYGFIRLGATATVATRLGGAGTPPTTLSGSVIAARGVGDSARWEVVVKVNNMDGAGNFILPPGYIFDSEFTEFDIV